MICLMFFSRQVHADYKNGRQNGFDRIKEMFYYKSNLIWSNVGRGLTMETFHETDGYYTHTVDSNLRLDTQTFVYQLNQPTPVPLNPVDKIDVKFGNFTNQQIMSIKWVSKP